jgi:hypothetical protein
MSTIIKETADEYIVEHVAGHPIHQIRHASGFWFHAETLAAVVAELVNLHASKERVIIEYGDQKTGQAWAPDCTPNAGTIGRSMGPIRIPLLIRTARSTGGEGILEHCIVQIVTSKGKRVLWQHTGYKPYQEATK